ncbi:Xaa-Pro peptidase family protein [Paracoccaceae bacterium]|nr:Xaa-Pro peptidase family protein [Paracoccaceae bacterium]
MRSAKIQEYGFSNEEFEIRLENAQELLYENKLDALLITNPSNLRYFTGIDTNFWESPTRPWFLVIPLSGRPIAIIPDIGEKLFKKTFVKDIHTWPSPNLNGDDISPLKSLLESLPSRFGAIGAELGKEMSIRMPILDFGLLQHNFKFDIVDGASLIWALRTVKTFNEMKKIEKVAQIVGEVFEVLPTFISVDDSERDVAKKMKKEILKRGVDNIPYLPVVSGEGGVSQIIGNPTHKLISSGDFLFIDTGATFDGYFCDFDRNFAIGPASDELKRTNEILWHATEEGIKNLVPGVTTKDIWKKINKKIEDFGFMVKGEGRYGHGVGLQLTEPPSISSFDNSTIQENMVLTIEPSIEYKPGKIIVHEENIFVSKDGPVLLTKRAPKELPLIS